MNPDEWNPEAPPPEERVTKNFQGEYAAETINIFEGLDTTESTEATVCFACGRSFEETYSQPMTDGTVRCKGCGTINYPKPVPRKTLQDKGVKYPNLDAPLQDRYEFYIGEIEASLAKRDAAETQYAMTYVEKALDLSERTPDAYLYKAICTYFLIKPRVQLIQSSAAEVMRPLDTAKRLCGELLEYPPYQIIAGRIARLYFRELERRIKRLLETIRAKRPALAGIPDIGARLSAKRPPQEAEVQNLERYLLQHIRQFTVCYKMSPDPLFLQREVEYYRSNTDRLPQLITPVATLSVEGFSGLALNDTGALQRYLRAIEEGRFSILCGAEEIGRELTLKLRQLQTVQPGWYDPEQCFQTPLCDQPLSLEQVKADLRNRIAEQAAAARLKEEERQLAARREREKREQEWQQQQAWQRQEAARAEAALRQARRDTVLRYSGIAVGVVIGLYLVFSAAQWVIGWFDTHDFLIGQYVIACLKLPVVLVTLFFCFCLFLVFWLTESLSGWIFDTDWNWSTPVIEWAWEDVTVGWLWTPTEGLYLTTGILTWVGILLAKHYWDER